MKQLYKFYKEHLHPIEPPPSFKLVLMWALQTGNYSINWNFYFGKQISYAAAEATWAIMLNANSAKDWDVVKAAMVDCGGDCRANQLVVCERDRESALRAQGERGEPVNRLRVKF